ncbi:hypothetical protein Poly24_05310 [Rosistilla carotiformis]|uniref:Sialate O-acetylesterase domain-containing protein n=1 Tax=Rosistilla carotiformis TaxID=2528017 RepID=A0A518JMR8_9BACT|nr:sialate O-acetylesterase [Rosistilla carotiformis]QDV66843.1 hypothetical protein Poly24_05310 [Rosistilla carotiformis]
MITKCKRIRQPALLLALATIWLNQSAQSAPAAEPAGKPLKVFILAGQSNMQGHAKVSTFDAMRLNPATAPLLKQMRNPDGSPRVCEKVWITSIGSADAEQTGRLTVGYGAAARGPKIGPEFTFGITMESLIDQPILIIKTAWGGKSLHTDFRPPNAGPYEFNETQLKQFQRQGKDIVQIKADKTKATGHYYRLMIDHVEKVLADIGRVYPDYDAKQGFELAGFVWFQGWNDMVDGGVYPSRDQPGGYDQYSKLLTQFIHDVRNDLASPKLPFVIGVMGVGGPTDHYGPEQQRYTAVHQNFRDAMAAPAGLLEFKGNVSAVLTEDYWDREVVRLQEREKIIKPRLDEIAKSIKAGTTQRDEGQVAINNLYAANFDERELEILQQSTSNAAYHYLGSAGIMAQIGKGFAEATVQFTK